MITLDKVIDMMPSIMNENTIKYASKAITTKNFHTKAIANYMKNNEYNLEGFYQYYADNEHEVYFIYSSDIDRRITTDSLSMRDGVSVDMIFADNIFNKSANDADMISRIEGVISLISLENTKYNAMLALYTMDMILPEYMDIDVREAINKFNAMDIKEKDELNKFIDEYIDSDDKREYILSNIECDNGDFVTKSWQIYDILIKDKDNLKTENKE